MTSCPSCNAPMAVDQRYCLNCGARGGEARLPFLEILRADAGTEIVPYGQPLPPGLRAAAPASSLPVLVGPPTAQERLQANSGLIAGVGVLLLAMLIGVLIGSGFNRDNAQAVAAPPQQQPIIIGGGAPAVAAATGPTGVTGPDPAATADAATTQAAASTPPPKAKSSTSSTSSAATPAKAAPKATNTAVKKLDKLTGKAAQKAADKLPKTFATGGKAPKKDAKPAAGGGSFSEIG
jgi:hypothetical protein